jgi:hypothetical protein
MVPEPFSPIQGVSAFFRPKNPERVLRRASPFDAELIEPMAKKDV